MDWMHDELFDLWGSNRRASGMPRHTRMSIGAAMEIIDALDRRQHCLPTMIRVD
jgi:hypothetical protein